MPKFVRMATTVGQLIQSEKGATLGYYLSPECHRASRREGRKEITRDKASFAKVHAIYAFTGDPSAAGVPELHHVLDALADKLSKEGKAKIDQSIDQFAEIAGTFCGDDPSRWFAGYMIRDQEVLTITSGPAVAYLYRNDTFFPLTSDQMNWPGKDVFGNTVKDYMVYVAGTRDHIRYSNILSAAQDDCILLGPQKLMADVGQRSLLHLFEEAEDQEAAVGALLDRVSSGPLENKNVLISFVEQIYAVQDDGRSKKKQKVQDIVFIAEAQHAPLRILDRDTEKDADAHILETKDPDEIATSHPEPDLPHEGNDTQVVTDLEPAQSMAITEAESFTPPSDRHELEDAQEVIVLGAPTGPIDEPEDEQDRAIEPERRPEVGPEETGAAEYDDHTVAYRRPSERVVDTVIPLTDVPTASETPIILPAPTGLEESPVKEEMPEEAYAQSEEIESSVAPDGEASHEIDVDRTTDATVPIDEPEPAVRTYAHHTHGHDEGPRQRISERIETEVLPQVDGSDVLAPGKEPSVDQKADDIDTTLKWPYLVVALLILVIIYLVLNLLDRTGVIDVPFLKTVVSDVATWL